jgi:CHASE2 domain-containing sensor protein
MGKLVVLRLDGDLEQQGFRVTLEIGDDGDRPTTEVTGTLPAAPELVLHLNQWQQTYRGPRSSNRLTPQEIVYGGSVNRQDDCRRTSDALRDRFTSWLSTPSFWAIDLRLRETLGLDEPIRVLIRTSDTHLHRLPWHLWNLIDRYAQAEIALGAPTFEQLESLAATPSQGMVKILAILGNSTGIDITKDRMILESLPNAAVTFLVEPQHQQITDQLWDQPWDILFFAGHSNTEGDRGRIYINAQESLTLEELKYGLRRAIAQGLQIAIFNSCDGLGLATELVQLQLPLIIVMREPVPDRVAQEFLKHFLNAFSGGRSFYLSARYARERLQGLEQEFPCATWLPVMIQSSTQTPIDWQGLRYLVPTRTIPPVSSRSANRWQIALITSVIATAVVLAVRSLGGLQRWELQAYDQLMQLRPPQPEPQRVLVVEATEDDINTYGYPLPDGVLAAAIDKLEAHQPRVIGLDIFRDRPTTGRDRLVQQLQTQQNLVALCSVGQPDKPNHPGIRPPLPLAEERLGFSNVVVDPDGILRRHLLFIQPEPHDPCTTRFSLGTLVALHYLETEGIQPQTVSQQAMRLGNATFMPLSNQAGAYNNLDNRGFQILLNYPNTEQFVKRMRLSSLLQQDAQLGDLANQVVLIGITAPVSNPTDYFLTPLSTRQWPYVKTPGVMIQAQAAAQVISAAQGERQLLNPISEQGELLWIGSWALVGGLLVWRIVRLNLLSIFLGSTVVTLYGISWGLLILGWWVPLVPAVLVLVISGGGAFAYTTVRNR